MPRDDLFSAPVEKQPEEKLFSRRIIFATRRSR